MFVTIGSRAGRGVQSRARSGSSSGREVLTADRTYYVRTDGADSNNGLSDHSGGAFLTLQKALNVALALDCSIYNVIINVGAGTYTAGISMQAQHLGSGSITFVGDISTPGNCVISLTSDTCVAVGNNAKLSVTGFRLVNTGGPCISVASGGFLSLGPMSYGTATGSAHIAASTGGSVSIGANYTVDGGANWHFVVSDFGTIQVSSVTVTVSSMPAFASSFCQSTRHGLWWGNPTFSGSATGARYSADSLGVIQTFGGGASYFPGSIAGSGSNPGVSPYGSYT